MKITLKSGREVTYEKPGYFPRAEIKDLAMEYFKKGLDVSFTVIGKVILSCEAATEKQLDDGEFTDKELVEIYSLLFEEFYTVELTKKK
jgi:hypothetical protein